MLEKGGEPREPRENGFDLKRSWNLARRAAPSGGSRRRFRARAGSKEARAKGRRSQGLLVPTGSTPGRLPPVRQLDPQSLALVHVRGEGFAVAVLRRALAHVLQAGLVVHGRVHLLVARVEDLRSETVAQPAHVRNRR